MITPIHNRVVVKPDGKKEKVGSIFIPDIAQDKPQFGTVLAAPEFIHLDTGAIVPCQAKTNDRILFGKYSGTEIFIEGEQVLIMRDVDILATIPTN